MMSKGLLFIRTPYISIHITVLKKAITFLSLHYINLHFTLLYLLFYISPSRLTSKVTYLCTYNSNFCFDIQCATNAATYLLTFSKIFCTGNEINQENKPKARNQAELAMCSYAASQQKCIDTECLQCIPAMQTTETTAIHQICNTQKNYNFPKKSKSTTVTNGNKGHKLSDIMHTAAINTT